jgi:hypothetical protein
MKRFAIVLSLVAVVVCTLSLPSAKAQKKGKTRPLTTSQLMAGLVKPQLVALKEGLAKKKKTDDDWKAIGIAAALLNESGYLMLDDDRSPDKIWTDGAEILRDAGADALKAVAAKDAEAGIVAVASVLKSCKVCHTEHKYKKK